MFCFRKCKKDRCFACTKFYIYQVYILHLINMRYESYKFDENPITCAFNWAHITYTLLIYWLPSNISIYIYIIFGTIYKIY